MLNLMKIEGSYEDFNIKIWGILSFLSPFAEIESEYSVFSTFLVLLGMGFILGQFLIGIPVLKSSGPQLSHGCFHFPFTLIFIYVMKHFTFLGGFHRPISVFQTKIFKPSELP